jgi:hypothetical protein
VTIDKMLPGRETTMGFGETVYNVMDSTSIAGKDQIGEITINTAGPVFLRRRLSKKGR